MLRVATAAAVERGSAVLLEGDPSPGEERLYELQPTGNRNCLSLLLRGDPSGRGADLWLVDESGELGHFELWDDDSPDFESLLQAMLAGRATVVSRHVRGRRYPWTLCWDEIRWWFDSSPIGLLGRRRVTHYEPYKAA